MRNGDKARFFWVLKMMVASFGSYQLPTISFNHFYEFFTVHLFPFWLQVNIYRQWYKINKKEARRCTPYFKFGVPIGGPGVSGRHAVAPTRQITEAVV